MTESTTPPPWLALTWEVRANGVILLFAIINTQTLTVVVASLLLPVAMGTGAAIAPPVSMLASGIEALVCCSSAAPALEELHQVRFAF